MRGRGSIVKDKRTGSWWVIISRTDPVTGKRKRQWTGPFRLKKEAERRHTEILAAVDTGSYVEASKLTVGAFFSDWLATKRNRVRPSTLKGYEAYVANLINPVLGNVLLQKLGPADLSRFYARLGEEVRPPRKKALAPATVRRIHTMIHQGLADAVKWSLIVRNPAGLVKPPRGSQKTMSVWSASELASFLDSSKDDRLFAMWRLLATTGARRGEVLGLRHSDVDLDNGTLTISRSLVVNGDALAFNPPKTAAGARSIDLDPTTVAALKAHRARQREERLALGPAFRNEGDLFFCTADGRPLHPNWVSKKFGALVRQANLSRIRLHDLRHSWASIALRAGIHPRIVQERLGHSSIAVTMGTYSHVAPGMGKEAGDLVAAQLEGRS